MNGRPDISVVMSVFNNADTLPVALDSILSQEGVELEFIVVNDGSTDGSALLLDEAARKDSRLQIIHQSNEGLTRALITGCDRATAPWIARQDADDRSLPGRLKAQLERARQPDAPDLVACGAICESPEGARLYDVIPPDSAEEARRKILDRGQTLCPHGANLIRTEAYRAAGGYREAFHFAQDLDLVMRLAERGPIATLPQVLYAFRFSPSSISARQATRQEEFRRLLGAARAARLRGEPETPWLDQARSLAERIRQEPRETADVFRGLYFIGGCLRRRDPVLARSYFARAMHARPWSIPAILRWLQTFRRPR